MAISRLSFAICGRQKLCWQPGYRFFGVFRVQTNRFAGNRATTRVKIHLIMFGSKVCEQAVSTKCSMFYPQVR